MKQTGQESDCNKFYRAAMEVLEQNGIPFLVGGAYAFGVYTGIERDTKDFDLFLRAADVDLALTTLAGAGYAAEKTFPHWLAKIFCGEHCIDLIYRAGNGLCEVEESWFARARGGELLGKEVKLCAPEEILWMKAFIMERERYDGADVAHLLQSCAESMDWPHLLRRFGEDWELLLSHLVLFRYIYPGNWSHVPREVIGQLIERFQNESAPGPTRICRGTLLSRAQYLIDVNERGYRDARLEARAKMGPKEIATWTAAIGSEETPSAGQGTAPEPE